MRQSTKQKLAKILMQLRREKTISVSGEDAPATSYLVRHGIAAVVNKGVLSLIEDNTERLDKCYALWTDTYTPKRTMRKVGKIV